MNPFQDANHAATSAATALDACSSLVRRLASARESATAHTTEPTSAPPEVAAAYSVARATLAEQLDALDAAALTLGLITT